MRLIFCETYVYQIHEIGFNQIMYNEENSRRRWVILSAISQDYYYKPHNHFYLHLSCCNPMIFFLKMYIAVQLINHEISSQQSRHFYRKP